MKTKFKKTLITLGLFVLSNCNQPGIANMSSNNIQGKDATKLILDAAIQIDTAFLSTTSISSSPNSSSNIPLSVAYLAASLLNGILVPVVAGLEEDKYYLKDGVDKCVKNIYALGLVIDNFITVGVTCDIKPTPIITLP